MFPDTCIDRRTKHFHELEMYFSEQERTIFIIFQSFHIPCFNWYIYDRFGHSC